jgi:hypothetical protein
MMVTRRPLSTAQIETVITDLVGLPFVRGARGPLAFDCWGVVLEIRARLGLRVPPDYASGELTREEVLALFDVERPTGWQRSSLTNGAIVLARGGGHAGVHLLGRIVHSQVRAGVIAWALGHWMAHFGTLECWEAIDG